MAEKKQDAGQKEELNDLMRVRREKMEKFREMGVAPFGHRYEVTRHADELLAEFASLGEEAEGWSLRRYSTSASSFWTRPTPSTRSSSPSA